MYCDWSKSPDCTYINCDRHMIVYITRLYTRLVTYARLNLLTLVISFYYVVSYTSFIALVFILIILLSFIPVYYVIVTYLIIMHEHSSLHTHSPGRFLTTLDLHVQIYDTLFLLCRCSMRPYALRRARVSPYSIPVFLSFLLSYYFLILVYIRFSCYFSLYLYDIMRGYLYVILQ